MLTSGITIVSIPKILKEIIEANVQEDSPYDLHHYREEAHHDRDHLFMILRF